MRLRALVFDAEKSVRSLLSAILKRRGHEVFCYPRAYICRDCDEGACADLIVTDVVLSGGSGVAFIRAQLDGDCEIKNLALMAGSWNRADREAAHQMGCKTFTKPFTVAEFESWVIEIEKRTPVDRVLSAGYLEKTNIPCD